MNQKERFTYHHHARAACFEGAFAAVVWSAADISARNLGAGALEVTLISMAPGVAQLLSLFVTSHLSKFDRKKLLLWSAFLGRLPLLGLLFISGIWPFIILLTIQAFAMVPITATWNTLLRDNYREKTRGLLYGKAARYSAIFSGIVNLGAGVWLDKNPDALHVIYPLAAVSGLIACYVFARITTQNGELAVVKPPTKEVSATLKNVLWDDKRFLTYEIGFFLYGLGFMAAMTARPLFAVETMDFTNKVMLGGQTIGSLMVVLGTVSMGKRMDKVGPAGLAFQSYALLATYCLMVYLVQEPILYICSQAVFGLAMSGVMIAWNMGPVTYAPAHLAAKYMGVHVALVGPRALIGHPIGGFLSEDIGPRSVFLFSFALLAAASAVMFFLWRRQAAGPKDLQLESS